MSRPLTLIEAADLFGRYRYVELELFSRLGQRATTCRRAELAVFLSGASFAHSYRAGLFESLLPVSADLVDRPWTRAPGPGVDEALALVTGAEDDELLDVTVGVLYPEMSAAYRTHFETTFDLVDGPVRRALRRALDDLAGVVTEAGSLGSWKGQTAPARLIAELISSVPGPFGRLDATA